MRGKFTIILVGCVGIFFSTLAVAQPYTTQFGSGEIRVDVVKRSSDDTVLVKGTIKNTSEENLFLSSDNLTPVGEVISVRLQDLKTKKQYEQVTVEKQPVGSSHGLIRAGQSTPFWARVTAPPKDVKQVAIVFAGDAAPIEDVTIAE